MSGSITRHYNIVVLLLSSECCERFEIVPKCSKFSWMLDFKLLQVNFKWATYKSKRMAEPLECWDRVVSKCVKKVCTLFTRKSRANILEQKLSQTFFVFSFTNLCFFGYEKTNEGYVTLNVSLKGKLLGKVNILKFITNN